MYVLHRRVPPSEMRQQAALREQDEYQSGARATGWFSSLSAGREQRQERKKLRGCNEFFASVAGGTPSSFVPVWESDAGSGRRYFKREGLRLHVAARTILQEGWCYRCKGSAHAPLV